MGTDLQNRTEKHTNKCIYSLDIAKFCLAIVILQLHSSGYRVPYSEFAVPLFFTISSYLFFIKYNKQQFFYEKISCLIHFSERVFLLYIFWFFVQLPYIYMIRKVFFDVLLNGNFKLILLILFNSTFIGSWFLAALVVGIIIVCFLSSILNKFVLFVFCFVIFGTGQFINFHASIPDSIQYIVDFLEKLVIQPPKSFLSSMVFLVLGKIIAENHQRKYFSKKIMGLTFAIISIIVLLENFFNTPCYLACSVIVGAIPFCYIVMEFLLQYSPRNVSQKGIEGCTFLRKSSTIIYCCHGGAACLLRYILYPLFGKTAIIKACMFPLTLAVSLFIAVLILTLAKKKYFKWLKYAY